MGCEEGTGAGDGVVTYQSWNCAGARPSLGCMVTYKMPGVALDAIAKANCDD
jgi:hypothetical protein